MLKAAKNLQEKMKKKKTQSKSEFKGKKISSKKTYKTEPLTKGKSYTCSSYRQPRERNLEKHRHRNYVLDTKNGGRNSKSGFMTRKCYRLGTGNRRMRLDRIYSAGGTSESE